VPGDSPSEAFQEYVSPLQRVLSCVTHSVLVRKGDIVPDASLFLTLADTAARLKGDSDLGLSISQRFQIVESSDGRGRPWWRVHTLWYAYKIEAWDGPEIMSFHWHPDLPVKLPHLHISAGAAGALRRELQRAHIPTGRVALEDVVRFLIESFGVQTIREDWESVLDETAALFRRFATW
jgi:hypothetical protein